MSLIKNKRQLALQACDLLQVHRWWGRLDRWHGLVTLNYHRIGNPEQTSLDPGVFSATAEQFEAQLRYLKADCDVIRVADVADVLRSGSIRRGVMITFDDGYIDNYEVAFPALKQVGLPAVIFLATGFLDDRNVAWWDEIVWMVRQAIRPALSLPPVWQLETMDLSAKQNPVTVRRLLRLAKTLTPHELSQFLDDLGSVVGSGRAPRNASTAPWMTWDMVREMHRGGIEFGGHTVTHPVLSLCSMEQQRDEIQRSKTRIEEEIGAPISAFSYPIGQPWAFSSQTMGAVQEAGYQWGFSFYPGYSSESSHAFDLRRVAMEPRVQLSELLAVTKMPRLFAR